MRVAAPSVGFYRYLYNTVGAPTTSGGCAARCRTTNWRRCCAIRGVSIHVLYAGGEPAGFFELDARRWPDVNLSYFGLMPHAVGTGVGSRSCARRSMWFGRRARGR